jgi:hypothetical protein
VEKQRHPATAQDESWRYQFPDGTDRAVERLLSIDAGVIRGGWRLGRCSFATPTDQRTIEVELIGHADRRLRLRAAAVNYVAPGTDAGDPPRERYPNVVVDLARNMAEAAATHTAGGDRWIDV